jgi:hypothetical protein
MLPLQDSSFFDQVAVGETEIARVERASRHPSRHHQRVPHHEEDEDVLEYLARLLEASRGVLHTDAVVTEDEQVVPSMLSDQRVPFSSDPVSSSSRHAPSSDAFVPHHHFSSSSPDTRRGGRQPAATVPARPIGGERAKQQAKAWQFVPQQHPRQQRWAADANVGEVPISGLSLNESFEAAYERIAKPMQSRSAQPRYRQQTARANPAMSVWIPEGARETGQRCAECLQTLTRKRDLRKHLQLHDVFECPACRGLFGSLEGLNAHRSRACYASSGRADN